jgi:hypothetical protein
VIFFQNGVDQLVFVVEKYYLSITRDKSLNIIPTNLVFISVKETFSENVFVILSLMKIAV